MSNYPWMCKDKNGAAICAEKPVLNGGVWEIKGESKQLNAQPRWIFKTTLWKLSNKATPYLWGGVYWTVEPNISPAPSASILDMANREFGPNRTIVKASEEAAELAAACAKLATTDGRCETEWADVIDETADVEITNERLALLYPDGQEAFEQAVHERKAYKLKRLEGLIDEQANKNA